MTLFTSFAVAGGTGRLGKELVAGLVAHRAAKVVVLSRSAEAEVPSGAQVRAVDYASVENMAKSLEGVDVLINALKGANGPAGVDLAKAAKASGVKLYVPNEFGFDMEDASLSSPLRAKVESRAFCAEVGLPTLNIATGLFPETTYGSDFFGINLPQGKVDLIGSLDTACSVTRPSDVGSFVGALLTKKSPEELLGLESIAIEAERLSARQIIEIWERLHPEKKVEVKERSIEQAEGELSSLNGLAFLAQWLSIEWAKGKADLSRGGTRELDNGLVPEWKPSTVEEYLATL